MTPPKKVDHTHAAASTARLPEHLQNMTEGAIIDWLIRTGQWDPNAQNKTEVQETPTEDVVPRETPTKQASA